MNKIKKKYIAIQLYRNKLLIIYEKNFNNFNFIFNDFDITRR